MSERERVDRLISVLTALLADTRYTGTDGEWLAVQLATSHVGGSKFDAVLSEVGRSDDSDEWRPADTRLAACAVRSVALASRTIWCPHVRPDLRKEPSVAVPLLGFIRCPMCWLGTPDRQLTAGIRDRPRCDVCTEEAGPKRRKVVVHLGPLVVIMFLCERCVAIYARQDGDPWE